MNVDKDFVDIALANIDLTDSTKFDENAKAFLKDNPKFTAKYVDKNGVVIGMTDPNNDKGAVGLTDAEKYMAKNPHIYKKEK